MENTDAQKIKLQKFKAMGIPVPMDKSGLEQPVVNVKDPKMLQRIQEIRSGAKKGEFKEILSNGKNNQAFQPLPEPKQKKNPNSQTNESALPPMQNFSPMGKSSELDLAASLFDDTPSYSAPVQRGQGQRIMESEAPEPPSSDVLNNFRARMQAKATTAGFSQAGGFGFQDQGEQAYNNNQNALTSMVESVATEVAKKVAAQTIKSVLDEYLSKKGNLNEGVQNTYKKVKDDIVLIEGKYYKLVPVKLKGK